MIIIPFFRSCFGRRGIGMAFWDMCGMTCGCVFILADGSFSKVRMSVVFLWFLVVTTCAVAIFWLSLMFVSVFCMSFEGVPVGIA